MWDQVWRELMGDRPLPDNAEAVVQAIRALGGSAGDGSGEAAAQVQRINGQVAELSGQVTALLTRVATLEAQPAPLPVLPTPPQQEESVEQQIERLTRAVQEKRLGAGSPELRQLMRLYQVARRGGGA